MGRVVITAEGIYTGDRTPVDADVDWVNRRCVQLAREDRPYLVEEPTSLVHGSVRTDGTYPYVVRAVMNTEVGLRLHLK